MIALADQEEQVNFPSLQDLESLGYAFLVIQKNEKVKIHYSDQRITGVLSVFNTINKAVSNYGKQEPIEDIGVDTFEFWCPQRRPAGKNLALKVEPALGAFQAENVRNGFQRPTSQTKCVGRVIKIQTHRCW